MASSPTIRNRFEKQGAGENSSTWGAPKLNTLFDLMDASLDGWTTKVLSSNVTLTSTNFAADESRPRMLRFLGTGAFQVTIPSVEKWYIVDNQLTGILTITTGAGTTATLASTESAVVACDGTNVKSLGVGSQSMKAYVDAKATLPPGAIVMWSGSIASIPVGWVLCNGANGSPNLMDRFIVGAGSGYGVGATGGAAVYALDVSQIPVHSHTQQGTFNTGTESQFHIHAGTTDVQGNHHHDVPVVGGSNPAAGAQYSTSGPSALATLDNGAHAHNFNTAVQNQLHVHGVSISGQTTNVGSGAAIENRPPFYALAYIMKT